MEEKRSGRETAKRYILFVISLFVSALGVAVTKRGELGVSPISSVANIMSLRFEQLTMGNWLIIWNCVLISGQIILLRKDFRLIQLLQVPLSFLFGWFTDIGMTAAELIPNEAYPERLCCVVCGTVILGFGISLAVTADAIMNSGEAFVKALSDTSKKEFGTVKTVFDISCVTLSVILSLIFFGGAIRGTREGTLIAALFTGSVVRLFTKLVKEQLTKILVK